jgi:hypothetical protein
VIAIVSRITIGKNVRTGPGSLRHSAASALRPLRCAACERYEW